MGTPKVINGDERLAHRTSTSQDIAPIGTKLVIEDGRTFRMGQCDTSTALVGQRLVQSQVPSANFKDEDCATMAAGDTVITEVGSDTGDAAKNWFENGYLISKDTGQLDPIHRVKSNTFILNGTDVGTIVIASGLVDAIAVGEKITYILNQYKQVILVPTTATALIVGVTVRALATDVYGWLATNGPVRTLQDGALVVGGGISASASVTGAIIAWVPESTSNTNAAYVGTAIHSNTVTSEPAIVFLRLDNN